MLNAPESFGHELTALRNVEILRDLQDLTEIESSLAFVTKKREVDTLGKTIARKAKGDAVVWFAYPKGTSKKYKSEINRDTGWQLLGRLGFECVRSVAIDEDWSAARFRRVEFIKAMNRDRRHAMTAEGKARLENSFSLQQAAASRADHAHLRGSFNGGLVRTRCRAIRRRFWAWLGCVWRCRLGGD